MHQSSHHATTCGGEGEKKKRGKITVLLFQIFVPVKLVWKWVWWWRSKPAQPDSLDPCVFSFGEKKNKTKRKKKTTTASGRDVRVPVHREDQGNGNPQRTPTPSPPARLLLPPTLPASYAIYSYLQYLTPALHDTTRSESSVWSHVNKGIKRNGWLNISCSLSEGANRFLGGVKQQNSRSFSVIVAVFFFPARWDAVTHRWTLGLVVRKNTIFFLL